MLLTTDTEVKPSAETHVPAPPHVHIKRSHGWAALNLAELWEYRELLYLLTWRDVRVRYKQTALGGAWAILQPVLMMVVFSIFFGRLMNAPSDGIPYPVFSFCALLPWQLFSFGLTQAGNSLVANQHVITKVYFPRLLVPLSAVIAGLLDFAVAFVVLLGLMAFYGIVPTIAIITLPFFILLALASAVAAGLWLSALNVQYRDIRHAIPFLTQVWLFATPIAYSSSLVPKQWQLLYSLNPMVGVVDGFRWALLGTTPPATMIFVSALVVGVLLGGGLLYFRRVEKTFADVV